jgi:uncharacterized membrane protein
MRWKTRNPMGRFTLSESIEIDASVESVFADWNRIEDFPRFMESVRRTKRIDERRVLWDVDIAGHQVVWEARIIECVPEKLVRWESSWGAPNSGEVRFEDLAADRTRLTASIEFLPQRGLEHLGARLALVDLHVRRDLERFRRFAEHARWEKKADEAG